MKNNLVAKHARTYNSCRVFRDRTKYARVTNHNWMDDIEPPIL